ncbi:hypothetical protein Tco_1090764 [Tanacetum coccineum]|uniref:Uncharacterized protein n=1 Tax=Tanacetum coccineum TaxID=301880 RepID=A0ABQ5I679_9ASTR
MDCMMVVKEIVKRLLEEVEKLEWWFEQDIDDEGEEYEEEDDAKDGLAKEGNASLRIFGDIGVQATTFMRRVLTDSRDNIGRGGDVLGRRGRIGRIGDEDNYNSLLDYDSGIQLEHEKEDEFVTVVVNVVHECRLWMGDCKKTLRGSGEKLEWWFEQDIDDAGEEDEEEEDAKDGLAKEGNASLRM